MSISSWDELFERFAGSQRYADRTLKTYRRNLDNFLTFSQSATPQDVTAAQLSAFHAAQKKSVASATGVWRMRALLVILRWAVRQGFLAFDPGEDFVIRKPRRPIPRILTCDEVELLLQAPSRSRRRFFRARDSALLETLYGSGLRAGEVAGLDLDQVDISDQTFTVLVSKGQPRRTPFGESVAQALATYLECRSERAQALEKAFFVTMNGYRIRAGMISTMVRQYADFLGIPDATPHALRRAFATHLLENGANIVELKALLGHADIDSTQYYAKINPTEMFFSYRKSHPRARRQEDRK